jgi:glycosyltransferase involved in cell wall biosynthesis
MKITIVSPNISGNCLGRSYLLARILQKRHAVSIAGPMFGDGVWAPLADDNKIEYVYESMNGASALNIIKWIRLYKKIDGDIIYVNKPLFTSIVIGIFKKLLSGTRLFLDIDDWEMGFLINKIKSDNLITKISSFAHFPNVFLGEMLVRFADEITVSNSFLQEKYGGEVIVHGRNTDNFNPKNFDIESIRKKLSIPQNKKVLGFIGTPLPYKGVEDLISALSLIKSGQIFTLIVGLGSDKYSNKIKHMVENNLINGSYKLLGKQPFDKLPEYLASCDIIVIPQRLGIATEGQLPAKLFDAMSMEVPVITTDIGDIKEILKENGWYFKPNDVEELHQKINYIIKHYGEAKDKAIKARKNCVDQYSWNSLIIILDKIIQKYNY